MKTPTSISKLTPEILDHLPSPVWLLEEHLLENNLKILNDIKKQTGVKILLALKGFAFWHEADIIKYHLDGTCASGLHEAMLGNEHFGGDVHTYSPAYKTDEIDRIAGISKHMVFNSPDQIMRFGSQAKMANPALSIGLRVNPEHSAAPTDLYNPCAPYSRLGTLSKNMDFEILKHIEGLHFHALCEQDATALAEVVEVFESKFGAYLPHLKWVNFGGGHHITRADYDRDKLVALLNDFRARHPHLEIYLEPGEAVGWETGVLVATVLDIVHNGIDIAILDTSAEAHMPDTIIMPYRAEVRGAGQPGEAVGWETGVLVATVLDIVHNGIDIAILDTSAEAHMPDTIIMPYRTEVRGAGEPGEKPHTYRLAGNTCLAGDIMGDYSFDTPLRIGDRIVFEDQMHYTMVKATTFNGIPLPSIAILRKNGTVDVVREFGYEDFRNRLG
jgi:carboxynorspermidine decarboxylase